MIWWNLKTFRSKHRTPEINKYRNNAPAFKSTPKHSTVMPRDDPNRFAVLCDRRKWTERETFRRHGCVVGRRSCFRHKAELFSPVETRDDRVNTTRCIGRKKQKNQCPVYTMISARDNSRRGTFAVSSAARKRPPERTRWTRRQPHAPATSKR